MQHPTSTQYVYTKSVNKNKIPCSETCHVLQNKIFHDFLSVRLQPDMQDFSSRYT